MSFKMIVRRSPALSYTERPEGSPENLVSPIKPSGRIRERVLFGDREREREAAALALARAFGTDAPAMRFYESLGNRQPDAGTAARSARAGFVDTVKAVKNMSQALGGNTQTVVFDGNQHFVAVFYRRNGYYAASRGIGQGVSEQIRQHLGDAVLVSQYWWKVWRQAAGKRYLLFVKLMRKPFSGRFQQRG